MGRPLGITLVIAGILFAVFHRPFANLQLKGWQALFPKLFARVTERHLRLLYFFGGVLLAVLGLGVLLGVVQ